MGAILALTSACAGMTVSGGEGCLAYAEARSQMPDGPLPPGPWAMWIADTDDFLTGACRG